MSRETIARLRALDPERTGTAAPPIDRLLARLDAEPDDPRGEERTSAAAGRRQTSAPRESGRRRPRRPIAAAVALACLAAVAVAALLLGGGNTAEQRDDALVPAGDGAVIVHTVSRTTYGGKNGRRTGATMMDRGSRPIGTLDGPIERWRATAPTRWRTVTTVRAGDGMPGGTMEETYARGTTRIGSSWSRRVAVHRTRLGLSGGLGFAVWPGAAGADGSALIAGVEDPRATVERMLASGEAHAGGRRRYGGETLPRFVSIAPERRVGDGIQPAARVIYLLDPDSYAPVVVESASRLLRNPNGGDLPDRWHARTRTVFDVYETLPLTSETAPLLRFGGPTG